MHIVWLILKWLLILVVILLIVGMIYEQYMRYVVKRNFVDNGTYVEVDGQKMLYLKKGEGKVAVVFESGLDFAGHLSWGNVQDEISKFATTISYDRAGILRSQKPTKPRTCDNIAEELHTLVQKVEGNKPFILKQIFVDSGHYIQLEKPEVVIEAVREMIEDYKKDIKK